MGGSHISLFAGVGMTDIAAEAFGFKTVATAEADEWNRTVLRARFPDALHYEDVRDVRTTAAPRRGHRPLLVSGGFPCQDISLAGHGAGLDGARSGLWSEMRRVIAEFQPEYVLAENVAALRGRGLDRVIADLTDLGYNVKWDCLPAAAVGAPHMRDRMFIAAVREPESFLVGPQPDKDDLIGTVTPKGVLAPNRTGPVTYLAKLPRAGVAFETGNVYEVKPLATQREVKAHLRAGEMLLPSPSKSEPGWKNLRIEDKDGNPPAHPNQRFYCGDSGRVVQKGVAQVAQMFPDLKPASHVTLDDFPQRLVPTPTAGDAKSTRNETSDAEWNKEGRNSGRTLTDYATLYPTPTRRDGMGGPGRSPKRTGGPNLRTVVNEKDGDYKLNPRWVEWMMGLPADWTDPDVPNDALVPFEGWTHERLPRTDAAAPHRRKRLEACGNGLVWQVACVALSWMLPTPELST